MKMHSVSKQNEKYTIKVSINRGPVQELGYFENDNGYKNCSKFCLHNAGPGDVLVIEDRYFMYQKPAEMSV